MPGGIICRLQRKDVLFALQVDFLRRVGIMESRTGKRWHLWAALAAAAIGLVLVGGGLKSGTDAATQLTPQPDRIIVVPVQVGRDAYGIAMVDMVGKTLWVYEINSRGAPDNRLRLLAARDWQYDQLLAEYNTGQPKPQQVRELLEKLGEPPRPERRRQQELEELAQPETD